VVIQYETEHVIAPWDARKQEHARYARKVRKPGFYTYTPEPETPEPVDAAPFEMTGVAKEAWKLQRELERDYGWRTDRYTTTGRAIPPGRDA
jgi:hypothetical protein